MFHVGACCGSPSRPPSSCASSPWSLCYSSLLMLSSCCCGRSGMDRVLPLWHCPSSPLRLLRACLAALGGAFHLPNNQVATFGPVAFDPAGAASQPAHRRPLGPQHGVGPELRGVGEGAIVSIAIVSIAVVSRAIVSIALTYEDWGKAPRDQPPQQLAIPTYYGSTYYGSTCLLGAPRPATPAASYTYSLWLYLLTRRTTTSLPSSWRRCHPSCSSTAACSTRVQTTTRTLSLSLSPSPKPNPIALTLTLTRSLSLSPSLTLTRCRQLHAPDGLGRHARPDVPSPLGVNARRRGGQRLQP